MNYEGLTPELYIFDTEKNDYVDTGDGISVDNKEGIVTIESQALERYLNSEGKLELSVKCSVKPKSSWRPGDYGTLQLPTLSIEGSGR